MVNINPNTGIAYGHISAHSLDDDLVFDLLYGNQANNISYNEASEEYMREIKSTLNNDKLDIESAIQDFNDNYYDDEPIIEGEVEGVKYRTSWLGGALHFWIFESPHTGFFQPCSPCVPGAADLDNPSNNGIKGYDVPDSWRYPNMGSMQA